MPSNGQERPASRIEKRTTHLPTNNSRAGEKVTTGFSGRITPTTRRLITKLLASLWRRDDVLYYACDGTASHEGAVNRCGC